MGEEQKLDAVCNALCQSGKFETGEGGCAPLCMSVLGESRKPKCPHRLTVHGSLAASVIKAAENAND